MDIQKIVIVSLTSTLLVFTTTAFSLEKQPNKSQNTRLLLAANDKFIPSTEEDAKITKTIKDHIANSKILSRFNIDVTTNQGIVTLKGNLDANSQATTLVEFAQSIVGVRDVNSELTVAGSNQVLRDNLITAKVKGLFIREGVFGPKRPLVFLNVETKNGVVHLTGNINDKQKVDRAIQLVRGVSGVQGVEYKFSKLTPHERQVE